MSEAANEIQGVLVAERGPFSVFKTRRDLTVSGRAFVLLISVSPSQRCSIPRLEYSSTPVWVDSTRPGVQRGENMDLDPSVRALFPFSS